MNDFSKHTPTELLKLANDIKSKHEKIKKDIMEATYKIDELELFINTKIEELESTEKDYVLIIEEIDKR